MLAEAAAAAGGVYAGLWVLDRPAGVLRCAAVWQADSEATAAMAAESRTLAFGWGVGMPGRVWAGAAPIYVPAVTRSPNFTRGPVAAATGIVAAYAVPVERDAQVIGVLEVLLPEAREPLSEAEGAVAGVAHALARSQDFPALAAAVPPHGEAERELQRRAAQQAAVAELGRLALAETTVDALLDEACRLAAGTLDVDYVAVLELHEDGRRLRVRSGTGWAQGTVGEIIPALRESFAGYTLMRGEPVVADDLPNDKRFTMPPQLAAHGVRSSAAVVIRAPGRAAGVLAVHSCTPRTFAAADIHFLRTVANVVAAALLRAGVETELRRVNALLDAIVTGTTDVVFVKDAEGRFVFVNDAGARLAGRPAHELLGLRSSDVYDTAAELEADDAQVMRTGEWTTFEEEVVRDGVRRWFQTKKGPYRDAEGAIAGVIGVARDVTAARLGERRARVLAEAGRLLEAGLDAERALGVVAQVPVPEVSDACAVGVLEHDGSIRIVAHHAEREDLREVVGELARSHSSRLGNPHGMGAVIRTGEPELLRGVTDEVLEATARDPDHLTLLRRLGLRSLAAVPLTARGRTFGALVLSTVAGRPELDDDDLALAAELARRAALAADNARLFAERQAIITTLQRGLLPPRLPELPGLDLGAVFHAGGPALDVGGDFYDVVPSGDGWVVVVGDVCGRGAEAATITGIARHTLRGAAMYDQDPASLLRALNEALLRERLDLRYCTVVAAHVKPSGAGFAVRLASAGHPAAVVARANGRVEVVELTGTLLGVFADADVGATAFELGRDDVMVLYTDGLLEVRRQGGTLRPADLAPGISRAASGGAEGIARALVADAVAAAGEGGLADDVAVLALRVR